jgi:hypothetical protein
LPGFAFVGEPEKAVHHHEALEIKPQTASPDLMLHSPLERCLMVGL